MSLVLVRNDNRSSSGYYLWIEGDMDRMCGGIFRSSFNHSERAYFLKGDRYGYGWEEGWLIKLKRRV